MKKNVIWWPAVKNKDHSDKYGNFDYFEYSRKTWEFWCKKNDVLFVPFEKPVEQDLHEYRINWQKAIFVFDELERRGIEYDQIALVDSTVMVKWDCPNFFELTDRKFTVTRDIDNMSWTRDSILGYKDFFGGFELDSTKYFRSGFMIFNEIHRDLFQDLKNFYIENKTDFIKLQDEVVRKGNDQTPINYWVQKNNVELKFLSHALWMCSHLHRKEMLSHNWQLNEDKTPFFIKYANNWMFNGIPKDQRTSLMSQTWELVKDNYTLDTTELLLNSVNHKDTFKNATSRKFKKDLIEFFSDDKYKDMSVVEYGACHGDTTKIFSSIFKKVYAYDWAQENVDRITEKCKGCDNVEVTVMDVVKDEWKFPEAQVVFVDASHDYPQVAIDIQKTLDYFDNPIIIMDDYGNPNNRNIRVSIDEKIKEGKIKIHKKIGEDVGYKTKAGWEMIDREGVILC
jgi:hypothetical protein|tara:strand:+ start:4420 stop:5778 length:1359 start_codon:yes stop_codon:yes gene_type:complete